MQSSVRSQTAEGAALARAVAVHEKDERIRGPDHLAVHLLGPRARAIATIPALRALAWVAYERVLPGIYMFHFMRTRHFDDIFDARVAAGVRQLVGGLAQRAPTRPT